MILFTDVHRFFNRLTDWKIQSHSKNIRIGQEGKVEVGRVWNIHILSSRVFLYCFQVLSMDTAMMKFFCRDYFGPTKLSNPKKPYGRKFTTYYGMVPKPKDGCSTKENLITRILCWMSYLFPLLHRFHCHTRTDFHILPVLCYWD